MRILIAEDDAVSRRLLEATLAKWGYEVVVCRDGAEAWEIVQQNDAPNLLILDWMMPGMDGVEVCRRIRLREGLEYAYIIMLTAKGQKEDVLEGLGAGADDYITKPFVTRELKLRLRAGRRILELQSALIAARDRLTELATHDPLTGLWNRTAILETLRNDINRSRREKSPLAIIMADLDHFKLVNDTLGHLAGDAVLREAAKRMRSVARPYDGIARYGGEEFLFIVPGSDAAGGAELAERIRLRLRESPLDTSEGMIRLTISLGVTSNAGIEDANAETLLRTADLALYRAKNAGRDRVVVASAKEVAVG